MTTNKFKTGEIVRITKIKPGSFTPLYDVTKQMVDCAGKTAEIIDMIDADEDGYYYKLNLSGPEKSIMWHESLLEENIKQEDKPVKKTPAKAKVQEQVKEVVAVSQEKKPEDKKDDFKDILPSSDTQAAVLKALEDLECVENKLLVVFDKSESAEFSLIGRFNIAMFAQIIHGLKNAMGEAAYRQAELLANIACSSKGSRSGGKPEFEEFLKQMRKGMGLDKQ